MEIFICKICQKECNGVVGLRSHSALLHKINSEMIYVDYFLNGVKPKCACGCGEETSFISIGKGFSKFILSHHNRITGKNNFHKNPETHKKAIATQKENWKLGKYKGWWEEDTEETRNKIESIKDKLRNNKERGYKISKSLTGVPKTDKCKYKISKSQKERYSNNPELLLNASKRRIDWLKRKQKKDKTILEEKFESILNLMGLKSEFQYVYKHRLFDFCLLDFNILIEVDGDFYHCHPEKYPEPVYEVQKITLKNDNYKNQICKESNIPLFRYWEKDINERPEWVITDLKEKITLLSDNNRL